MKRQLLLAAAVLAAGNVLGLISPAQAQPSGYQYYPRHAPPPQPRYEQRPPARPGQVWVPGHWRADGSRYAWAGGYWVHARPGYRYVPDNWARGPHGWVLRPGYWAR